MAILRFSLICSILVALIYCCARSLSVIYISTVINIPVRMRTGAEGRGALSFLDGHIARQSKVHANCRVRRQSVATKH
eukprot:750130-Hanusia_phi.AAC.11